jgi:hypothetical protein
MTPGWDAFTHVLESTGFMTHGQPSTNVSVGESELRGRRLFQPDATWRGPGPLRVFFKYQVKAPGSEVIASWRHEVWNEGFAPLLWVISPERIDLYNGYGTPLASGDADANRIGTFRLIKSELEHLDSFAGRLAMETGEFWRGSGPISQRTRVDRQLLRDLAGVEAGLIDDDLSRLAAQRLIGQVIFTQYLSDRGIVTEELFLQHCGQPSLAQALGNPQSAKQLFSWLRLVFNGDLFRDTEGKADPFKPNHLSRLARFLAAEGGGGQTALFPYRFDIIPVELISSIYEQFAHSSLELESERNTGTAEDVGVHYTPLALVSLVLDEAMAGLSGTETVLDLTCGSGVFLVEALRRLVLRNAGPSPTRGAIRSILEEQIYGVDLSEAAIRVTAFSLYLTALELDPDPNPPEALTFKRLIGRTLHVGDARTIRIPVDKDRKSLVADVIVGNPPWTFQGKTGTATRRQGARSHLAQQSRGQGLDFVSRALDFAGPSTRLGVVLAAPPFFAGSEAARALVTELAPVTIVNLAPLVSSLFANARMPAVIFFARCRPAPRGEVTVVTVPWSIGFERSSTFSIARQDIATLSIALWNDDPTALKTVSYGSNRDAGLISRVRSDLQPLQNWLAARKATLRDGLIVGRPPNRTRDAKFLRGLDLLEAPDLEHLAVPRDLKPFEFDEVQWPRDRDIYRAPLLLVKEFFRETARPIAAVSARDLVFTDAYFGAALDRKHADDARIAAAILSSSFAAWFFYLTASEFGVWKRRLLAIDARRMPMAPDKSGGADGARRYLIDAAQHAVDHVPPDWEGLDEAVLDVLEMGRLDRIVIRDGFARANRQWEEARARSIEPARDDEDLLEYALVFASGIDAWLQSTSMRGIRAEVLPAKASWPIRVIRFVIGAREGIPTVSRLPNDQSLMEVLDEIGGRLNVGISDYLVGERELRVHGPGELVIIKPAARRNWSAAAAIRDSDAAVAESLIGISGS